MNHEPPPETSFYQLGVVRAAINTPIRRFRDEYRALYYPFESVAPLPNAVTVDVRPARRLLGRCLRYRIDVNGRFRFSPTKFHELLPYVEWAVNWELPRVMPEYLQLHASSMEFEGAGVIFAGDSGSGKSTLATALLARGWRYLCDEFALIHTASLQLHPFPRAICMKRSGDHILERLGLTTHRGPRYLKGVKGYVSFVNPLQVRPDAIGCPAPVRFVIFPSYSCGAEPTLVPVGRAEAALDLHRVCFNLFSCQRPGTDVLAEVVRGASCYRLQSGEIDQTCALLEDLVTGGTRSAVPRVRSLVAC